MPKPGLVPEFVQTTIIGNWLLDFYLYGHNVYSCVSVSLEDQYSNAFISSVIWQKGESQKGGNKNTKHTKFSDKRTLFTP